MYAETAFNLPVIILLVDEQYRAVFAPQSVIILSAAALLLAASTVGLVGESPNVYGRVGARSAQLVE